MEQEPSAEQIEAWLTKLKQLAEAGDTAQQSQGLPQEAPSSSAAQEGGHEVAQLGTHPLAAKESRLLLHVGIACNPLG